MQTLQKLETTLPDFGSIAKELKIPRFQDDKAYVGVASIPSRSRCLRVTISSLYNQCERIFVYLNNYDAVPSWLNDKKISIFRSQDFIDLNATGKVFFANMIDRGYFFSADDDFAYPHNYTSYMINTLKSYNDKVAACVHGSIFPPELDYYYLRTAIYQYQAKLPTDKFVCLPGTGSFVVKSGAINLELGQFLPDVMVDLACAILCKEANLPLISVKRPDRWLRNSDRDGLYQLFSSSKTHHTYYAQKYGPWGFDQYRESINLLAQEINLSDPRSRYRVDTAAFLAAKSNNTPQNWQLNASYYDRLANYFEYEKASFKT